MQQNRAWIRTDILRANAQYFRSRSKGAALCAVVKADGYGHGAAMTAQALSGVADMYAVSLVEEGARLRQAGIGEDILVLTPPLTEEEVVRGAHYGLLFTVGDGADYALLARVSEKCGFCTRCHIKVNTGMNRYGFSMAEFRAFVRGQLSDFVQAEGIYSHFYRPEDGTVTRAQYERFLVFCRLAERTFGKLVRHISATGGVLASEDYCLDMVRVGIGIYGYLPSGFSLPEGTIRPAMRIDSTVAAVHRYRFGGAGYGSYVPKCRQLSTVRTGYADGFFRCMQGANNLCMDARVAEISAKKYDDVCVFSDADAYAAAHGTISYEALVRIAGRAVKMYVDGER